MNRETREIKFRAWDASIGEMYRPDFIDEDGNPATFAKYDPEKYLDIWEMHPVMQYTGLKDKDGKDIYEGDIIQFEEVKSDYPDDRDCYAVKFSEVVKFDYAEFSWASEYGMVIGNIYENPELLEKTEGK